MSILTDTTALYVTYNMRLFLKYITCTCLILTCVNAILHEPSCSKFDYDKKMLEMLVRLENKMEDMAARLSKMENTVAAKFDAFEVAGAERNQAIEDEFVAMETRMLQKIEKEGMDRKSQMENTNQSFTRELKAVTPSSKERAIAFMAQLSKGVTDPDPGYRIVYDHVITNEGGAYNNVQGTFTAPLDGVYNFNVIASSQDKSVPHALHLHIMKNGSKVAYIFLDQNQNYWFRRSTDITIKLTTGEQVWVEVGHVANPNFLGGCCFHNHFSGFLVGTIG